MPIQLEQIIKTPGTVTPSEVDSEVLEAIKEAYGASKERVNRNGEPTWDAYYKYTGEDVAEVRKFIKNAKTAAMHHLERPMVAAFRSSLEVGGAAVENVTYFRLYPYLSEKEKEAQKVQAEMRKREREAAGKGTPGRKASK